MPLKPFEDDAASASVGGLTLENGRERVAIYGQLDITRDKQGLAHARALLAVLEAAVSTLGADPALPDRLPPPPKPSQVRNPFG